MDHPSVFGKHLSYIITLCIEKSIRMQMKNGAVCISRSYGIYITLAISEGETGKQRVCVLEARTARDFTALTAID